MRPPLFITEVLPNPKGKDKGNEWLELCSDTAPVSLNQYRLTIGTRKLALSGVLEGNACVVVKTGTAPIRNREAILTLSGPGVTQTVETAGSAPEDISFIVPFKGSPYWGTSTPGIAPSLERQAGAHSLVPGVYSDPVLPGLLGTGFAATGILTITLFIVYRRFYAHHNS